MEGKETATEDQVLTYRVIEMCIRDSYYHANGANLSGSASNTKQGLGR